MRPLVKYPSSKWSHAKHYDAPRYPLVIEPFAGGAGYSVYYEAQAAILNDRDERVAAAWRAAICGDIASVPPIRVGDRVSELVAGDMQWLVRSWSAGGGFSDKAQNWTPSFENVRSRLTDSQPKIASWQVFHGDYRDIPDVEATWFIDPPYKGHRMSKAYRHNAIDYSELAEWCKSRRGQVIVCEAEGADWLPFRPLYTQRSKRKGLYGTTGTECVWTQG